MGKFTPFVETVSIFVLAIFWIFSFFPLTRHVDKETMNWGVAIYCGVTIVSFLYYFAYARKVYKGPVTRVKVME